MIDPTMAAAHRRAIDRTGELVTFQRVFGVAPNARTFSAQVRANVKNATPEGTEPAQEGLGASQRGAITQTDRQLVVMAQDLVDKRFPMPLRKHDKVILADGTKGDVTRVDPHKRQLAGAIEIGITEIA